MEIDIREFRVRDSLPDSYYLEIGNVIFQWARLEMELRQIVYLILRLDNKEGRIAVRTPRADQFVDMISDLMSIKKLTTTIKLNVLKENVLQLRTARDAIGHGVWVNHDATTHPVLQAISGTFAPAPNMKKVKARIYPNAIEVKPGDLAVTASQIQTTLAHIKTLKSEIEAALPKPPQEST